MRKLRRLTVLTHGCENLQLGADSDSAAAVLVQPGTDELYYRFGVVVLLSWCHLRAHIKEEQKQTDV